MFWMPVGRPTRMMRAAIFLCRRISRGDHPAVVGGFYQKPQAQHAGHQLADIGGDGGPRHAHAEDHDEHQIQHDVGHRGPCQIDEGAAGVSGGVQDAGSHVVHYTEQHAAKIDADVGHGIPQHLGGGIHGHQQGPAAGDAAHSEQQAHDHGDGQRGVHGLLGFPVVLGPQELRHHHARAHGQALAEADEQVDGGTAGAHGGQRVGTDKVAHDDAVGGVVQLLQQVAEDQRQGEQQQALHDAALGHQIVLGWGFNGVCHGRSPFDAVDENYLLP